MSDDISIVGKIKDQFGYKEFGRLQKLGNTWKLNMYRPCVHFGERYMTLKNINRKRTFVEYVASVGT